MEESWDFSEISKISTKSDFHDFHVCCEKNDHKLHVYSKVSSLFPSKENRLTVINDHKENNKNKFRINKKNVTDINKKT